jgi:hypothetical protein
MLYKFVDTPAYILVSILVFMSSTTRELSKPACDSWTTRDTQGTTGYTSNEHSIGGSDGPQATVEIPACSQASCIRTATCGSFGVFSREVQHCDRSLPVTSATRWSFIRVAITYRVARGRICCRSRLVGPTLPELAIKSRNLLAV